jgi:anti-sigma B factor antagonist
MNTVESGTVSIVRPREHVVVVELLGEHDLGTVPKLREALLSIDEGERLVVVDISHTEFMDSTVLLELVRAERRAEAAGRRFRLQVGTERVVKRLLEVSGLLDQFDVVDDRESALGD